MIPFVIVDLGGSHPRMAELQLALRCPDITGVLDMETSSRLRGWQWARGMETSGVVDAATGDRLGWVS